MRCVERAGTACRGHGADENRRRSHEEDSRWEEAESHRTSHGVPSTSGAEPRSPECPGSAPELFVASGAKPPVTATFSDRQGSDYRYLSGIGPRPVRYHRLVLEPLPAPRLAPRAVDSAASGRSRGSASARGSCPIRKPCARCRTCGCGSVRWTRIGALGILEAPNSAGRGGDSALRKADREPSLKPQLGNG
jgi:hypothetical protein